MARRPLYFATVAGSLLLVGTAFAATNGDLGMSSTATTDITIDVPDNVRISGVDDFAFGEWNGSGAVSLSDQLCVYSSSGAYSVTVADDSGDAGFKLKAGTETLVYMVSWSDDVPVTGYLGMSEGTVVTGQTTLNSSSPDLCESPTAQLQVTIGESALLAATPGSYAATLTVLIAPE